MNKIERSMQCIGVLCGGIAGLNGIRTMNEKEMSINAVTTMQSKFSQAGLTVTEMECSGTADDSRLSPRDWLHSAVECNVKYGNDEVGFSKCAVDVTCQMTDNSNCVLSPVDTGSSDQNVICEKGFSLLPYPIHAK